MLGLFLNTREARRCVTKEVLIMGKAAHMATQTTGSRPARDRRMRSSTLRVVLCALLVGIIGFTFSYTTAWGEKINLMNAQSSTDVFKSIDLKTLEGDSFTTENLKSSRITLFNVWATTCAPCIAELPALEELNHSYDPGEIQVVGLLEDSLDANGRLVPAHLETAQGYLDKVGATFPTLALDEATYAYVKTASIGTPTTFFVNSDGEIIHVVTGSNSLQGWKQQVDTALSKLG